jgi:hypothetical protein
MRNGFHSIRSLAQILLSGAIALAILFFAGCGGSNSGGSNNNPPPPGTTTTQFRIGDGPADRVISFQVSVGPITATGPSGTVTILSTARRVELTHMAGTTEPLAIMGLTQGSYSGANLTVGNAEATWIGGSDGLMHKLQSNTSTSLSLTFSPAVTVTSTSAVFQIELIAQNLLSFDAGGDVSGFLLTNSAGYSFSAASVGTPGQQHPEDGLMEDTRGMVTSVSGTSFTLTMGMSGTSLTFTTDANTQFGNGISNVAGMLNQIVKVQGGTISDGTLYAAEVDGIEDQNGMEMEGMVSQVSPGAPAAATQVNMYAHDGMGGGMMDTMLGGQFSVDVSTAGYKINGGNMGSISLTFNAGTMVRGQRIEVESNAGMGMGGGGMMGSITAQTVTLEKQSISGVVTNYTSTGTGTATFDITLPVDSYLTLLNPGKLTVHVIQQQETDVHNLTTGIFNSLIVHVRGLLFYDPVTGFTMVARRVGP